MEMWEYFSTKFQYPKLGVGSDFYGVSGFGQQGFHFPRLLGVWGENLSFFQNSQGQLWDEFIFASLYMDLLKSNIESGPDAGLRDQTADQLEHDPHPQHPIPLGRACQMWTRPQQSPPLLLLANWRLHTWHWVMLCCLLPLPPRLEKKRVQRGSTLPAFQQWREKKSAKHWGPGFLSDFSLSDSLGNQGAVWEKEKPQLWKKPQRSFLR